MLPSDCTSPVEPCCDTLYDIVAPLVDAAADAVGDCLGTALCPDPFPRYVSHGQPATVLPDYVAGYIAEIRPMPGSRGANAAAKQILPPRLLVACIVRLVETGHPNIDASGGAITLPTAAQLDYAAVHSYSHAQRALAAMLGEIPDICRACNCDSLVLASMRPDGPTGGVAPLGTQVGWEWRFDVTW